MNFFQKRSFSLSTVVLVLFVILLLQESVSYTTSFGRLENFVPGLKHGLLPTSWLILRGFLLVGVLGLWILNRKRALFTAIMIINSVFTLGLLVNMIVLLDVLFHFTFSAQAMKSLLVDVVLLAVSNILIFSIWYWVIDPPGVEESRRDDAPWDFLFPQRGADLPHYEAWLPRYTDYIFLAFTTSFAFSPTDTLPLTRRAKLLMLLQATISIVTLTAIAGSAINILAGRS